jgi:hypothetical protein
MNDILFNGAEAEDLDLFGGDDDIGEYYGDGIEDEGEEDAAEYFYNEDPRLRYMRLDELEELEIAEAGHYRPDGYTSEIFSEYEPDLFDDSLELSEALREVLHEDYENVTPEEMQNALFRIFETMTPAEGFNLKKALIQISKPVKKVLRDPTVGQLARPALQMAGGAIGGIYGGPVGAALGSKLGQVAGQAFSGGRQPISKPASPKGGSAAAAQLLQLTQNPDMLKALMALALGSHGRKSIGIGKTGQSVGIGALMSMLSKIASKANEDADELFRESAETSGYLIDSEGNFLADPAVPEERAEALYNVLSAAENQRVAAAEVLSPAFTEFYDELDEDDHRG